MAGDWIKMRPSLLTSPKVNGIARLLESDKSVSRALATGFNGVMSEIVTRNVMRNVTVASLLVIWGAANEHTVDGVFHDADLSDLDDMVGIPGFGEAMESVGWVIFNEEECSVTLPNFIEYNTSGKERSATAKSNAERQQEYRDRKKQEENNVTSNATNNVTSNRREEERREEKSISQSLTLITGSKKPKRVRKPKANEFTMTLDWSPSVEFEKNLPPNLITTPSIWIADLLEFCTYRKGTGELLTQSEWEHKFLQNLEANKKHRGQA